MYIIPHTFKTLFFLITILTTLGDDNKNITGERRTLYFIFMGGPVLIEDLGGLAILLTCNESLLKQQRLMKLLFMQTSWLPKPLCFHILSDCGINLLGMEGGEGGEQL